MLHIRKSADRGHLNFGWLDTYHTFSFGDYYDPEFMGFRDLRVINQDSVQPGYGFPTHGHRDMEIITYVTQGALEHKDSMGNGSTIRPGEVQYMSAGSGVRHSEFNHSKSELVQLLQIWIMPNQEGAEPRYAQKEFPDAEKQNVLRLIVSPDGREGSIAIRQDVSLYASVLDKGHLLNHHLGTRYAWLQVVRGAVEVNGQTLTAGDGLAAASEEKLAIKSLADAEFLLFDLN